MILDIGTVEQILQDNVGGLKRIRITDINNPQFDNTHQVFVIHFRKYSAKYEEKGAEDIGGYYATQAASMILPKGRVEVEYMIKQIANRQVAVETLDNNEKITRIVPAKMVHDYMTGLNPAEGNEYNFTFSGINTYRLSYIKPEIDDNVNGDDGTVPGTVTPDTGVSDGDPGGPSRNTALIVRNASVDYVPLQSGNPHNRNEVITASDGNVYIIDIDGRAKLMSGAGIKGKQTLTGVSGTTFSIMLPTGVDQSYLSYEKVSVIRNGIVLIGGLADDIQGWTLTGTDVNINSEDPLVNENLEIIIH